MIVSNLYASGAVFQRRMPIVIQGKTDPCSKIRCSLAGKTAFGGAGLDGSFHLRFPALEAGGPFELKIENLQTGDMYRAGDIRIGEVYLASGQSNMGFMLKDSPRSLEEFLAANQDAETIRIFKVGKHASACPDTAFTGEWKNAAPENIPLFPAVAAWFAKKLRDELKIPVGVIVSAWGGTRIHTWISRNGSMCDEKLMREVQVFDQASRTKEKWKNPGIAGRSLPDDMKFPEVPEMEKGIRPAWVMPEFDDSAWIDFEVPGSWIGAGITGNGAVRARKIIEIPPSLAGCDSVIHLGGIDKNDVTFLNGIEIGRTGAHIEIEFCDTPRAYHVPGNLVHAGKNIVSVRAASFIYDGAFAGTAKDYFWEFPNRTESFFLGGHWKIAVDAERPPVAAGEISLRSTGPENPDAPNALFNGMIAPLVPFTIRGFLWYQGESDTSSIPSAREYEKKLQTLIRDWRTHWCQGDIPFLTVQIPSFHEGKKLEETAWTRLRESQRRAVRALPNTGMICTLDCGDAHDIHPQNKKPVGERLADLALNRIHGFATPGGGPVPVRMEREESALRIYFENCDGGIVSADGKSIRGFHIADERPDGRFYEAEASVEGRSIRLSSREVKYPARVRYAWADNPADANLSNGAGYPAATFELPEIKEM